MMRRFHLFELEDQPWLPSSIRDGITDFLQFAVVASDLYGRTITRLQRALQQSGQSRIIDLCSGGGGAWPYLAGALEPQGDTDLTVQLTDIYPNHTAFAALHRRTHGKILSCEEPVNAMAVPARLQGFRTLFSSFHHFKPEQARAILADAVTQRQPLAVLESTQRHPLLIAYMLFTPLIVLLSTPFIRPFSWNRLLWTYLLPAIPFAVMFDGIVSCLRTYTVEELEAMVASLPPNDYSWDMGVQQHGALPVGVTYLIGLPGNG